MAETCDFKLLLVGDAGVVKTCNFEIHVVEDAGVDKTCDFKLLLVGDAGVGKTCVLSRYAGDAFIGFNSTYIPTIGEL